MSPKSHTVYIDACPLIDMAESKATVTQPDEIQKCVWYCRQILRAARDKKVRVFTSFLSIAECTSINCPQDHKAPASPSDDIKRFYDMLLISGKSGIELVPMTLAISIRARNLRWVSDINLKGADTIHVASALQMQCTEIWTRDGRIWKNREKLKQLGINVLKPYETDVLPAEYRTIDLIPASDSN